ncbi:hypothetical protein HDU76_010257, partial [Blyttiomyces sp. JEL0837]
FKFTELSSNRKTATTKMLTRAFNKAIAFQKEAKDVRFSHPPKQYEQGIQGLREKMADIIDEFELLIPSGAHSFLDRPPPARDTTYNKLLLPILPPFNSTEKKSSRQNSNESAAIPTNPVSKPVLAESFSRLKRALTDDCEGVEPSMKKPAAQAM